MAMMAGFTACKKDMVKTPDATPAKARQKTGAITYAYVDLTLQPRNPGDVTDTYSGFYGAAKIIVQGTPAWNLNEFPTPAVGMPLVGLSISAAPGYNANIITPPTTETVGIYDNAFAVAVGELGSFNYTAFFGDFSQFRSALDAFEANPGIVTRPNVGNFVGSNYAGSSKIVVTSGKLIWVSTGSHIAIGEIKYPYPKSTATAPSINTAIFVTDPLNSNIVYALQGIEGILKSGYISGGTGVAITVTGSYTPVGNSEYHATGVITRVDNTTFSFDVIEDPR